MDRTVGAGEWGRDGTTEGTEFTEKRKGNDQGTGTVMGNSLLA
jgi:hypothetical protein